MPSSYPMIPAVRNKRFAPERKYHTDPKLGKYHTDKDDRKIFTDTEGREYYFGQFGGQTHKVVLIPSPPHQVRSRANPGTGVNAQGHGRVGTNIGNGHS